jgi:hypothetical protein
MRRGLLTAFGMVLVGAWVSDCGPPPVPLTGSIHYNSGCNMTMTNPPCASTELFVNEATSNSGTPPAIVSCAVAPGQAGGNMRLRFSIGRSETGNLNGGEGLSLCGEVGGNGQDMTNTRIQMYFLGDSASASSSVGTATDGTCQVHINNISSDAFDGWIRCSNVPSSTSPPKLRYIQGVQGGQNPTADPMNGDVSFVSCTTLATACPQ